MFSQGRARGEARTNVAAGMLVAEQQFRRIIGYRDLAKLVAAIERHTAQAALPTPASIHAEAPQTITV